VLIELKEQFVELRKSVKADDPSVVGDPTNRKRMETVNAVIDEFWTDTPETRLQSAEISKDYLEKFGDAETGDKYLPPWLRPEALDPSEM
jgi:hypothetical protein